MRMPNRVCKVSLNFTWQGKPVKNTDGMYFEGKKVYLGYGWKNIEIETGTYMNCSTAMV